MGATALCGCVLLGARPGRALDRAVGADGRLAALPLSIPVGLPTSAVIERARGRCPSRPRRGSTAAARPHDNVPTVPGLAAGAAVLAVLWGAGWAERWTADQVRRLAPGPTPGSGARVAGRPTQPWLPAPASGSTRCGPGPCRTSRPCTPPRPVDAAPRPAFGRDPMVSGDPASLVSWDSSGREGRRHAVTYVRPEAMTVRPPLPGGGVPEDLSIPTVMGEPARAHPVQVFVGLDKPGHGPPAHSISLIISLIESFPKMPARLIWGTC